MKVAFEALIRKISHKSLVSGDKSTQVTLEFDSTHKLKELNALNKLQRADGMTTAVIMDEKEIAKIAKK